MKPFVSHAAALLRYAPIALLAACASSGGTVAPTNTADAESAPAAETQAASEPAPATEVAAQPEPAPAAAAPEQAEPAPMAAEAVVAAVEAPAPVEPAAAPAETPAEAPAETPDVAPAKASLAAFEVRGPVLAAGVSVLVREGASVLTRPVAGAQSATAPTGFLTLGASVDNADGTWWYVRHSDRTLGWVNQKDIATLP